MLNGQEPQSRVKLTFMSVRRGYMASQEEFGNAQQRTHTWEQHLHFAKHSWFAVHMQ